MAFLGMSDMSGGRGSARETMPSSGTPESDSTGSKPLDPVKEGVDALKKLLPF
jgi:hypothetical protein